jgi:H+/Na+-translocating ferredoxin:NAD+ oxidoreductase subunit C
MVMLRPLLERIGLSAGGFPGGIHPEQSKLTAGMPVRDCPLPPVLIVPVKQHIGESCAPLVEVGQTVRRGQKIARAQGYVSAPVHAPTSGKVVKIEEHPMPHPSGLGRLSLFIEPDGKDTWEESLAPWPDYRQRDVGELRERVRICGLAGLGGAVFPTFIKLVRDQKHPIDTVILNGIECEPYLTNDHRLMLEQAEQIVSGLDVLMYMAGARHGIIAVEDNKPDAAACMREAAKRLGTAVAVHMLPTRYPQGGEKQLIQAITGREVPAGKLPMHIGILCQNVGTTKAVHDAVVLGRPLTERVVTISGNAVPQPGNMNVRLGTPIRFVFAQHGLEDFEGLHVIHGGPLMGERLPSVDVPVAKSTNGMLAFTTDVMAEAHRRAEPCIRCGHCVEVCPVRLVPNELANQCRQDQFDRAQGYGLFDCIECGCCSYVCPSNIPLVQYFRYAKGEVGKINRERIFADLSRQRSQAREERIAREQADRAAKRARVKADVQEDSGESTSA